MSSPESLPDSRLNETAGCESVTFIILKPHLLRASGVGINDSDNFAWIHLE